MKINPDDREAWAERFWSKVDVAGSEDCWLWSLAATNFGYGKFAVAGGRWTLAHREAWRLTHGEIPEGLCVCHRCDNPPCCNPSHLFLGSQADNAADMASKGRARGPRLTGETHHRAKLTDAAIAEIRARTSAGERRSVVARAFGVSHGHVGRIARGTRRTGTPA